MNVITPAGTLYQTVSSTSARVSVKAMKRKGRDKWALRRESSGRSRESQGARCTYIGSLQFALIQGRVWGVYSTRITQNSILIMKASTLSQALHPAAAFFLMYSVGGSACAFSDGAALAQVNNCSDNNAPPPNDYHDQQQQQQQHMMMKLKMTMTMMVLLHRLLPH